MSNLLLSIFILFSVSFWAQENLSFLSSEKDLVLFHKLDKTQHGTFERVEIGFIPKEEVYVKMKNFLQNRKVNNDQLLNPYLSWQVRYRATFTHTSSGEKKSVEGFYFQDYERKEDENRWLKKSSNYPFRFRVALPKSGAWKVEVKEWILGKEVRSIQGTEIQIQAGNHKGFVKVHPNTRNFERDGKMIYPVGANLFSPYVDNNLYYSGQPKDELNVSAWKIYHEDVEKYVAQGGKYIRFIMEPTSSEIEFEKLGNYTDRLNYAWEMDQLFAFAEEKDLLIQFDCMIQSPFKVFDNEFKSWDFGVSTESLRPAYAYQEAFMLTKPSEIITNPEAFKYFKERYRYIMARWGYSTQVSFFELMSEPFWMNQDDRLGNTPYDTEKGESPTRKAVAQFHHQMAKYIKEDLGYTDHLLAALGHMPGKENPYFPNEAIGVNDNSWESPHIDVICMNVYKASASHFRLSDNNILSDRIADLQTHYRKPIYFSETQTSDQLADCSGDQTLPVDIMATGFIGIAGFNLWEVFYHRPDGIGKDDRSIWPMLIKTQEFMQFTAQSTLMEGRGEYVTVTQVENEKIALFKKAENIKEIHYYLGENGKDVNGVIMNRSYNVYTNRLGDSTACEQFKNVITSNNPYYDSKRTIGVKNKEILIQDLEGGKKYKVVFYSYKTGKILTTTEYTSKRSGKLKIEHPALEVEKDPIQPVLWFSIDQIVE